MRFVSGFILIVCASLVQFTVNAQADSAKTKTIFKVGVYYNSHLHYYGRTDSLQSSAVFPMAEVWFDEHFYINAAPVFINNARQSMQYAGTVATAGYQFNDQKRWSGNTYIVKPFYKNSSGLVQSALKAQVSSSLTLHNKVINITGGADLKLSDKLDYGAAAGLDHIFRFALPAQLVLVLDPSACLNAGTQQFAHTYYQKNNFLLLPGTEQAVTETVSKFNILSYEFSLPVILGKGKFQFLLIPAYVMPQHLIAVEGRPDLSEHGHNLLYVTAGAKVAL